MKETREIVPRQVETVDIERPFELQNTSANNGYGAYRDNAVQDNFQLITYWRIIRKRFWLVVGINSQWYFESYHRRYTKCFL
jgi:hypothetical protein